MKRHTTDEKTAEPTQLYRHYDADGNLLYIGISLSTVHRLGQHRKHAHWFRQITSITVEHFPSKVEATEAEALAISRESPRHNIRRPETFAVRLAALQAEIEAENQASAPKLRLIPLRKRPSNKEQDALLKSDECIALIRADDMEGLRAFMERHGMR